MPSEGAVDVSIRCRACLRDPGDLDVYELAKDIRELFEKCTEVSLPRPELDTPPFICAECWDRCENWQEFRKMCQMNDNKIRKHTLHKPEIPQVAIVEEEESMGTAAQEEIVPEKPPPPDYQPLEYQEAILIDEDVRDEVIMEEQEEHQEQGEDTEAEVQVEELDFSSGGITIAENPLDCPICLAQYYTVQDYETHIRSHYTDKQIRACLVCHKQYTSHDSVVKHTFEHGNLVIPCPHRHCKKDFKGWLKLRSHLTKYHKETTTPPPPSEVVTIISDPPDDVLQCPVCHALFAEEDEYDQHIKEHYAGRGGDTKCLVCGKPYKCIGSTVIHTHEHSRRNIKCTVCEKTYRGRPQMRSHINKYHANDHHRGSSQETSSNSLDNSQPTASQATHPTTDNLECPVCLEDCAAGDADYYDQHIKGHYAAGDRQCALCDEVLANYWALIKHTHEHGSRQIRCQFCPKVYNTRFKLSKHTNKYHRKERDTVSASPFLSIYEEEEEVVVVEEGEEHDRFEQEEIIMEGGNNLVCEQCCLLFETQEDFEGHQKDCVAIVPQNDPQDSLECPVCQEVLATEKHYEEHIRNHYRGQTENKCLICEKKYNSAVTVAVHTQEHGWRRVTCQYCLKVFKGRMQLVSHQNKYHHAERRGSSKRPTEYHCDLCGKTFLQKYRLNAHLATHTMEREFACDQCPQHFKTQRSLRLHYLQHTGQRTVPCPECDMKFFHAKNMKDHLKRHQAKPVHECEVCQKRFSYKAGLNEHLNTHTKARSFECELCGKVFQKVSVLHRHRMMHQGKQFFCNTCGQSFRKVQQLEAHMKRHEEENGEEESGLRASADVLEEEWGENEDPDLDIADEDGEGEIEGAVASIEEDIYVD